MSKARICGWLGGAIGIAWAPVTILATPFDPPVGSPVWSCSGTDSKPQSKIWYHDGRFGSVLDTPDGNRLFLLQDRIWMPQETPDAFLGSPGGRADVLWDGTRLIVLVAAGPSRLFEFEYSEAGVYRLLDGFPITLAFPESETKVLDRDSAGRLWLTYTSDRNVYVAHSGIDHRDWERPQVLREGISKDDISSIVAFGGDRVGVLWSDQKRDEYGFRVRQDCDPVDSWSEVEIVDAVPGCADDHMNLATDSQGHVYAATKNSSHRLNVHRRFPGGGWETARDVLEHGDGTRPIIVVAEQDGVVNLLYSRWHEGAEVIARRTTPLGRLRFGPPQILIAVPGLELSDVTCTKNTLPQSRLVAIASGGGMAWWNGWGFDPPDAPLPLTAHIVPRVPAAALALGFDEGHGSETADASAHVQVARLGGPWAADGAEPTWVRGISGTALRFDGRSHFVEVASMPPLELSGSLTIDMWFRRATNWTKDALICKGQPGARTFQIRLLKDDQIEFLREDSRGKNHVLESRSTVADSAWHHVACVFDANAGESRLYLDGVLDATTPDSSASAENPEPVCIGARFGEDAVRDFFHGDIDQVQITPGVRFTSDFTPSMSFETEEQTSVFVTWPRYFESSPAPRRLDLVRCEASGLATQLNVSPLLSGSWLDAAPPAGTLVYQLRQTGAAEVLGGVSIQVKDAHHPVATSQE